MTRLDPTAIRLFRRLPDLRTHGHAPALDTSHLLVVAATPVVLISACGLVTLALYNRLGAILARLRAIHQQKIGLLDDPPSDQAILLDMLDSQIVAVTRKGRLIQNGLCCLLAAIAALLLCSVFAGASVVYEGVGIIALGTGVLGVFLFLAGLGWAMKELTLSLTPLEEETAYLDALATHRSAQARGGRQLKIAE